MSQRELCVIFNPAAGKNRARRRLEQIRASWGTHVAFRPSEHAGHAIDLAEQAAREDFSVVAAAGGDGTAHEVLNGLMRVRNPDVQFTILPIGSANDYAYSLGLDNPAAVALPRLVDVGLVRAAGGKSVYFGCCLGLGFNGRVTWEARHIRRLQGVFLYGLAAVRALIYHYHFPLMTLHIDDEPWRTVPTLMFSRAGRQTRRGVRAGASGVRSMTAGSISCMRATCRALRSCNFCRGWRCLGRRRRTRRFGKAAAGQCITLRSRDRYRSSFIRMGSFSVYP